MAWADMAGHWAVAARRLIEAHGFLDVQLGYVALHLSIIRASMLVNGYKDEFTGFAVRPDSTAAVDCPIDVRRLRSLSERTGRIRDQIMHLADGLEAGRVVKLDAKRRRVEIIVVGKAGRTERMTERQAIGFLDTLEPWMRQQRERLMRERQDDGGP